MANVDKKIKKLVERIKFLEEFVISSLTKKTSNVKEINVAEQTRKIQELKKELLTMTPVVVKVENNKTKIYQNGVQIGSQG